MEYKDYYQIMGVERSATQDEIKRAYRKLARKYHPDVSKESDTELQFKEVGEAYEVLKDPEKRSAYDQLGTNWKSGQDFNTPPGWGSGFEFSGNVFTNDNDYYQLKEQNKGVYSDFFESLFGKRFQKSGSVYQRGKYSHAGLQDSGSDHHAKILIDLEDSMNGVTRSIDFRVPHVDTNGHVVTKDRVLKVTIPKGIKQGQHIRLLGQGNPSIGKGDAGDLYLEIEFNPHSIYRIDGEDVYLDLPVTPREAALGASVRVPTPVDSVDLKIKPGSKNGSRICLKENGIPARSSRDTVGDFYVVIQVVLPPVKTDAEN